MAEFRYKARDSRGRIQSGTIVSTSKADAKAKLNRMRLKPLMLKGSKLDSVDNEMGLIWGRYIYKDDKGRIQIQLGDQTPTSKDLIVFTKQFATMINSGVPLIQALGLLASQQRVRSFGKVLEKICFAVENGATLS